MTSQIQIHEKDGSLYLRAPFTPELAPKMRQLGGKWSGETKTWRIDARDRPRLLSVLRDVYGYAEGEPLVFLRVHLDTAPTTGHSSVGSRDTAIFFGGREIAVAWSRDGGARLGPGVVILKGGFFSSGSRKNPACYAREGTVVEIKDVPKTKAMLLASQNHGVAVHEPDGTCLVEATFPEPEEPMNATLPPPVEVGGEPTPQTAEERATIPEHLRQMVAAAQSFPDDTRQFLSALLALPDGERDHVRRELLSLAKCKDA